MRLRIIYPELPAFTTTLDEIINAWNWMRYKIRKETEELVYQNNAMEAKKIREGVVDCN